MQYLSLQIFFIPHHKIFSNDKRRRKPLYPSTNKAVTNNKTGANGASSQALNKGQHPLPQPVDGAGGEESETGSASSSRRKGRLSRRRRMRKSRANSSNNLNTPPGPSPAHVEAVAQGIIKDRGGKGGGGDRCDDPSVEGNEYHLLRACEDGGLPLLGQVDPDILSSRSPGRDSVFYTDRQQGS